MALSKMLAVCAIALGGVTLGCKSDCESACDDRKDCHGGEDFTDCSKTCDAEEDAADRLGCKSQLDDLLSCIADIDDACKFDQTKQCTHENDVLAACAAKYCDAHPGAEGCT